MSIKEDYLEASFNTISRLFPKEKHDKIRSLIKSKIKERLKNPTINLDNNVTGENRDIDLTTLCNWIEHEKPIISGNGTFYTRPDLLQSPTSNMLRSMKTGRSKIKKSMFSFDPLSDEYRQADLNQQNLKVIMNAEYGGSGNPKAAFYTKYSPAATTLMAQSMVTTAAAFFEAFLGNNQKFFSVNEFTDWLSAVITKDEKLDEKINTPTEDQVINRVRSLFYQYDLTNDLFILNLIRSLNKRQLTYLYYANNVNQFIKDHLQVQKIIEQILIKLPNLQAAETVDQIPEQFKNQFDKPKSYNDFMSKEMFLDPYNAPEIIKSDLEELSNLIIKYCFICHLTPDSIVKLNNQKRKTVLLVDTDSNVVNANLFVDFILTKIFPGQNFGRPKMYNEMILINTIASILSKTIDTLLKHYCKLHNFSPNDWKEIVMKNEFMFKTFFIMDKKKRYTASIVLREGHIMIPFKLEIKGMDFIKAAVSETVTKQFTNILRDNILFSEKPNLHGLMNDSKKFEKIIYQSILNGETEFFKTQVYKDAKGYKNADDAWRLQVYRGVAVWNELYPLNKIYSLDRVKIIKLKVKNQTDLNQIRSIDPQIYDDILTKIFNSLNPSLVKAGLEVIAVPLSLKKLPPWLIQLVDKEITISDIMSSFGSVFRVLQIETTRVNTVNNKAVLYTPIIAI